MNRQVFSHHPPNENTCLLTKASTFTLELKYHSILQSAENEAFNISLLKLFKDSRLDMNSKTLSMYFMGVISWTLKEMSNTSFNSLSLLLSKQSLACLRASIHSITRLFIVLEIYSRAKMLSNIDLSLTRPGLSTKS